MKRNKNIHLAATPRMTRELARLLKGVERDINRKSNLSPTFSSAKKMDVHLDSL